MRRKTSLYIGQQTWFGTAVPILIFVLVGVTGFIILPRLGASNRQPTIKVDNSIVDVMAHNENLIHLDSASGNVRIDVTYLKDPLTDICYALISGGFPDSETTFDGMAYVPCEKLK